MGYFHSPFKHLLLCLGTNDAIVVDWGNGIFKDNFSGVWGSLDGSLRPSTFNCGWKNLYHPSVKCDKRQGVSHILRPRMVAGGIHLRILIINKFHLIRALTVCLLIIGLATYGYGIGKREQLTSNLPATAKIIVIDPGHGGIFPGAVAQDGTLEKDINLNIALYLRELLEQNGSYVIMTRESDIGLYSEGGSNKKKKNEDLENRKKLAQGSHGDLFVSIHLNSFPQSQYYGAQTFYPKDNPSSQALARAIQEELVKALDVGNRRAPLIKEDVYVINGQPMPTVLVECGFLSNPQELKKLNNKEYQRKIAWGIYLGIQKYFHQFQ